MGSVALSVQILPMSAFDDGAERFGGNDRGEQFAVAGAEDEVVILPDPLRQRQDSRSAKSMAATRDATSALWQYFEIQLYLEGRV